MVGRSVSVKEVHLACGGILLEAGSEEDDGGGASNKSKCGTNEGISVAALSLGMRLGEKCLFIEIGLIGALPLKGTIFGFLSLPVTSCFKACILFGNIVALYCFALMLRIQSPAHTFGLVAGLNFSPLSFSDSLNIPRRSAL